MSNYREKYLQEVEAIEKLFEPFGKDPRIIGQSEGFPGVQAQL